MRTLREFRTAVFLLKLLMSTGVRFSRAVKSCFSYSLWFGHNKQAFSRWSIAAVAHAFPRYLSARKRKKHLSSLFVVWVSVKLTVWSVLHGVRWRTLSALGGPLHRSVLSPSIPSLADHPDSDGCTVLACHSCRKAPDPSPPNCGRRYHPLWSLPEVVSVEPPVNLSSLTESVF